MKLNPAPHDIAEAKMPLDRWDHFFKPAIRSSGRTLVAKAKQSRLSDTEVLTYFRVSSSVKVVLTSPSISSDSIVADCNCVQSKKGVFCKYVWAALLLVEKQHPDFLEDKTELDLKNQDDAAPEPKTETDVKREEYQTNQKARQADFRKQQYQKQKERAKEWKKRKEPAEPDPSVYPPVVERSLEYFSLNGFDLREAMTVDAITAAKKKLARVFHPDLGGTHDEIIALNHHSEILMKYAK